MENKTYFLVYARKSGRHDWQNFGRSDNALHCTNQAHKLIEDIRKDSRQADFNWNVKMVTVTLPADFVYEIPVTLKANINFLDAGMIPFGNMQSNPDQTTHNGGN